MLRNIIFGCIIVAGLISCQSDTKSDTNTNSPVSASSSGYQGGPGSVVGPPVVPPQNTFTSKLMTDYWVFEFYIVPGDRVASRAGQGRWYKFHPDGTFESGRWEDEVWGSGNWYFMTKEGKNLIRIDANVDAEDTEWELQGSTESAMSWSGTNTYGNGGIILKALNLMTIPTRAQFNFQE